MTGRILVGTAGHVDHGKTALVSALTGVDPRRLPEERRRGMTIVPAFVPLDLPGPRRLGLVDVPGHARFVRNMLAGAAGIDLVLLVVAADEGVMPQTVEHLHILQLLGVRRGVAVLTKADRVDRARLEQVRAEVQALLAPTPLRDAPILAVSAVTHWHIPELKELLARAADAAPPRSAAGACRLPVDRVFTKAGFGVIATGTLWGGRVEAGGQLERTPGGALLRVRGVQVHGAPVEAALAGQRTAVNLAGPGAEAVKPGDWLAMPGLLRESYRLDVALDLLPDAPPLARGTRLRVFHGTREVLGRVRLGQRAELAPGGSCRCRLELEHPLAAQAGDRFILRTCSPAVTVAGGAVLDPCPARRRPVQTQTAGVEGLLDAYHRAHPLRRGMPLAELGQKLFPDLPPKERTARLEQLAGAGELARLPGGLAARPGFRPAPTPEQRPELEQLERAFQAGGYAPPDWAAAARGLDPGKASEYRTWLLDQGRLVRAGELLFAAGAVEAAERALRESFPGGFSLAQARDCLGTTRRYALALLELLDARGVTVRTGELRRFRR